MKKTKINSDWLLCAKADGPFEPISLPRDEMIREKRNEKALSGSAGAFFEGGKYIYRKTLHFDNLQQYPIKMIEFEGIYQHAEIYLNQQKIAEHFYGYGGFIVDLSDYLKTQDNLLEVVVDNTRQPNSRWYTGAGIYRDVWLYEGKTAYFVPKTAHIKTNKNEVVLSAEISAPSLTAKVATAKAATAKVAIATAAIYFHDELILDQVELNKPIQLPNPQYWSCETPNLYHCHLMLTENEETVDEEDFVFGLRDLQYGPFGLKINDQEVLLRGGCIHSDEGMLGSCEYDDAAERKIDILKKAGFNAIRSSHNPLSEAMLRACDRQGMLVVDEIFDSWLYHKKVFDDAGEIFKSHYQKEMQAMVNKDFNHPCVILYSIGNEISELGLPEGQQQAKEMVEWMHQLDNSRPVSCGINLPLCSIAVMTNGKGGVNTKGDEVPTEGVDETKSMPSSEFFNFITNIIGTGMEDASARKGANRIASVLRQIFDVPGYNYGCSRYLIDAKEAPQQPTVGMETFTASLYKNWQGVKTIPTLIGDFMWTAQDYLGEVGIGVNRYLDKKTKKDIDEGLMILSGCGVIDLLGNERPEVGYNKAVYGLTDTPTIAVEPYNRACYFKAERSWRKTTTYNSWSWKGCEGIRSKIYSYGNGTKAVLYINDQKVKTAPYRQAIADFGKIAYQKGKIEVVSLDEKGDVLGKSALYSAQEALKIQLSPSKDTITAATDSLVYIDISLCDENGILESNSDCKIRIQVKGEGKRLAFGSGRAIIERAYDEDEIKTEFGRAQAIIASNGQIGDIIVEITSETGLKQSCCIKAILSI